MYEMVGRNTECLGEWMTACWSGAWLNLWLSQREKIKQRLDERKWVGDRLINKWNCEQMRTRGWVLEMWVVVGVSGFVFEISNVWWGVAYEQNKMHVDFKHCIQSAKPFFSDKLKLFRVLFVVSVSKCRLGFTITVFAPLRGHVNTRKNFICIDGTPKLITSAEKKKLLWTISLMRVYITRTLLVFGKEKAIIQARKQVQSIGLLHIFLAVLTFPHPASP
jgi:hypothetical protein